MRTDRNWSSRRNMSRYTKTVVQIEKFVTDADSNMPPSVGIILGYADSKMLVRLAKYELFLFIRMNEENVYATTVFGMC